MRYIKKRSTFVDAISFGIHCIVNQNVLTAMYLINSIQTFTFNFIYEKDKNNYVDNNVLKMALSLNCKEQEILYVLILCMEIRKKSFLLMQRSME